jgi:hypothetical protein
MSSGRQGRGQYSRRERVAEVGIVSFTVIALLFAWVVARSGSHGAAVKYFLMFALVMVFVLAFLPAARSQRQKLPAAIRTVVRNGMPGTEIRYSARQLWVLVGTMGSFAVCCLTAAVELFIHQEAGFPGAAVVPGLFGLLFASFVVAVALGRIARGEIVLSAQGMTQRGWSFESRLNWSAISGAGAVDYGSPSILVTGYANAEWDRRYTARLWRIDRLPSAPLIEIDCRRFDVDPAVLHDYLKAYVDHPELRSELGTDAAIDRARLLA